MTADEILKALESFKASDPGHSHKIWEQPEHVHSVIDPGHSHGLNYVNFVQSLVDHVGMPHDTIIRAYMDGIAPDALQETRTYWHQWYHGLSLSHKYYVDAFRMKVESDQVKKITPAVSTEIVPHPCIPGGLIYQVKTNTGNLVAQKAKLVDDKLVWTPVCATDNVDQPKTPETKEEYEKRRNSRISDRLATELSDMAKKKAEDAKDAPERHWSDTKPWPGAHGSQYMLKI